MKRLLLYSWNNAKSLSGKLVLALIMAFLSFGSTQKAYAQCVINQTGCPVGPIVACADQNINGISGATISWTPPNFTVSCDGIISGYDWIMKFDLPESQSSNFCWAFNGVQRVGNQGGVLVLNQSTGSGLPSFMTPSFIISDEVDCSVKVNADQNFIMKVYYVDAGGNKSSAVATVSVPGIGAQTVTFHISAPATTNKYRLFFEFTGLTNNKSTIDELSVDALVDGEACSGDVNFYTTITTTNGILINPEGSFLPVGTDKITYTAYYNSSTVNLSSTCAFDVTVNGVTATTTPSPASCDLDNGSFVLTAASTPSLPSYEYSLNGGLWTPFTTPLNLDGLDDGTYNVNVRGNFPIGGVCDLISNRSAVVTRIVDNTPPSITCALSDQTINLTSGLTYTHSGTAWDATATDECNYTLSVSLSGTTEAGPLTSLDGVVFNEGTTLVTFKAIDLNLNESECSFNVTVNATADLSITKVVESTEIVAGEELIYKIVVSNAGPSYASNVVITDNVTAFTSPMFSTDGTNYNPWNGTYNVAGNMAIGTMVTLYIKGNLSINQCSSVTNSAAVSSFKDNNSSNNTATVTSTVVDQTDPAITCVASTTKVVAFQASYTVVGTEFDATASDNCSVASISNDFNNTATLTGALLSIGVHEIVWTVIDNSGNQNTCTTTITVQETPSFSVVKNDVTCYNAGNGIITITPLGGQAPYTYSINNGADYFSTAEFTSLTPGSYMIRVKDVNGIESPLCQ